MTIRKVAGGSCLLVLCLIILAATVKAQSSTNILIPYGMSAGMQVFNRAVQPRPVMPTPAAPESAYAQIGDRRLVCEQWNGQRWVIVQVAAKQCVP
jgi:hypothetical protein